METYTNTWYAFVHINICIYVHFYTYIYQSIVFNDRRRNIDEMTRQLSPSGFCLSAS